MPKVDVAQSSRAAIKTAAIKTAAIYARLSVHRDESVSVERQFDRAREYAAARGWTVVLEVEDKGVSATRHRPQDRAGWSSLLQSSEQFDAVIVWKIDRLARRTIDFLETDRMLRDRGAGIVSVEEPIDMTTAQGRGFATMLAVFAEMEADAIAARVRDARRKIIQAGRRPGGRPPFGFMNVDNPDGPGKVLAHDPERIDAVRRLTEMALEGASLYSMARWLDDQGVAPRSRMAPGSSPDDSPTKPQRWHPASVDALLRSPALAGLVLLDGDVLRGEDHLPVIDESVAILTPVERQTMLDRLDAAKRPGTRQQGGREPALLYGLARCGNCRGLLYRATANKKYRQYRCQQAGCPRQVGIAREGLEQYVIESVLDALGDDRVLTTVEVAPAESGARLAEIELAIDETTEQLRRDDVNVEALVARLRTLKDERLAARNRGAAAEYKLSPTSFRRQWEDVGVDIEARRQLLLGVLEAVMVDTGGGRGRLFDPSRVDLVYRAVDSEALARQQAAEDLVHMRGPVWESLRRGGQRDA